MKDKEYVSPETGEIVSKNDGDDFATVLLNMSNGASHRELSEELAALVTAVEETGKPGHITYKLAVKPAGRNLTHSSVVLSDSITAKKPEFSREESIFFTGEGGTLHRNNPHQPSLWAAFENEGN